MNSTVCLEKSPSRGRLRGVLMVLLVSVTYLIGPVSLRADDAKATSPTAAEVEHDHSHDDDHDHGDHDHSDAGVTHEAGHDSHAEKSDGEHAGEHAAEADVPPLLQFDFGSAVCNLAIFLGVFAILSKFVWPEILGGLKAREQKIHGDLVAAEKANADAKALLGDYQTQLNEASTKVQSMLTDARKDAEASGQRIVDEAKAEAERQRDRAVADIDTAKKVALSDLAGKTSDMAIAMAGQMVGRELKSSDHAELIHQSLQRLPSDN